MATTVGVTLMPGRTRMSPLTTTLSPALTPDRTMRRPSREAADLDRAVLQAVALAEDEHELAVLVRADGRVTHQQGGGALAAHQLHPGEQPRREPAVAVGEDRAGADGPAGRVDPVVHEVQPPLVREPGLVGQAEIDREARVAPAAVARARRRAPE